MVKTTTKVKIGMEKRDLFKKYLPRGCQGPGTVSRAGDTEMNQTIKVQTLKAFMGWWTRLERVDLNI